jgi:hypothetical protein
MLSGDAQIVLTGVATLSLATSIGLAVNGVRTPRVIRDAFEAAAETLRSIAPPPDDPELSALLEQIDAPAKDDTK